MSNSESKDKLALLRAMASKRPGTSGFSRAELSALKLAVEAIELLKSVLDEMEDMWWRIDGEWGPAEGGLNKEIAEGREPIIAELRKIVRGVSDD